jgi:hypothetical protein
MLSDLDKIELMTLLIDDFLFPLGDALPSTALNRPMLNRLTFCLLRLAILQNQADFGSAFIMLVENIGVR